MCTEYKAMKQHWESRDERLLELKAKSACREIFLGSIIADGNSSGEGR